MKTLLAAVALVLLALPPVAAGGGFATVQLSTTPAGTPAGGTWTPTLTVLAHGRTPLDGLRPAVRISDDRGTTLSYPAEPTGEAGRYRAEVTFPHAATWRWEIWDGFTQTHGYRPVQIGEAAATGAGEWPVELPLALVVAACVVLAAAGIAWRLGRSSRSRVRSVDSRAAG